MAQVSKWCTLPNTFYGLANGSKAVLRLRKVDNHVELWPKLALHKNIVIPSDLTIEVTLTNDTFHADAEINGSWTVTVGDTVLTLDSVAKDSDTQCTLTFTGAEAIDGTITIMAKKAALVTGDYDSGVLTIATDTGASSCTEAPALFFTNQIAVDAENPSMIVVVNNDEFISVEACEDLANWDFDFGDTELAVSAVTWLGERTAGITLVGTAVAGAIGVQVLPGATMAGSDANYQVYTIDDAADTVAFTQSEIAGDLHLYQFLPGESTESFVAAITPVPLAGTALVDVLLTTAGSAFLAQNRAYLAYDFDESEHSDATFYAKMITV